MLTTSSGSEINSSKNTKGFLKLAKSNKKTYKIIDSNLDVKTNEDLIINQIKKLIKWI